MDDYEKFEEWLKYSDPVDKLIKDLHIIVDACIKDDNFGVGELEEIQDRTKILMKQGDFWIESDNPKRFVYDLKQHLYWICDFMEKIIDSNHEDL